MFDKNLSRSALLAATVLPASLGLARISPVLAASDEEKGMAVILYEVQMAPAICRWANAPPAPMLDTKIAEAEAQLGITPDEKTGFKAQAEADLRKNSDNCAADGLVRSMYDDAAAGKM